MIISSPFSGGGRRVFILQFPFLGGGHHTMIISSPCSGGGGNVLMPRVCRSVILTTRQQNDVGK